MEILIGSCGLNCLVCEAYQATKDNDDTRRAEIAIEWSKRYEAQLTAADINCEGCTGGGAKFSWCGKCPIRACATGKGYQTCAQCEQLPCETVAWLLEAVPEAKANLEAIRN